jgi:hypothetical protein
MIHLRLSRRVQGRVDDSDVLQETFLEVARRLKEYTADPKLPFYLWLRHMAGLKLAEVHRRHLGTQLRDADREVTLHRGGLPAADSVSLAAHLLGQLTTPSQAAIKAETRLMVQEALNSTGLSPSGVWHVVPIWVFHGWWRLLVLVAARGKAEQDEQDRSQAQKTGNHRSSPWFESRSLHGTPGYCSAPVTGPQCQQKTRRASRRCGLVRGLGDRS